jgi:hypothetical protein
MSDTPTLITFLDHIGRATIGELVEQNDTHLVVKNPAIIHVQPTPQGQLNVQTIPLYFREFVGEKTRENGTTWKYNISSVVIGVDVENDARLVSQYEKLFSDSAIITPNGDPQVVKLFDE